MQLDSWALRGLSAKNTLTAADAGVVEEAFLAQIGPSDRIAQRRARATTDDATLLGGSSSLTGLHTRALGHDGGATRPIAGLSPRKLALFVGANHQTPIICASRKPRALGRKVSDEFTVPLCRSHHRELHRAGNEVRWWARFGIDPIAIADKLWSQTHPVPMSEATAGADSGMSGPQGAEDQPGPRHCGQQNYETNPIWR